VVLDPEATIAPVATGDRETVEAAPPHPVSATVTATPHAATVRTHDLRCEYVAAVGGDIELR
jgi:hypothetical protein